MGRLRWGVLVVVSFWVVGCGDEPEACTLGTTEGCDDGQVCEAVEGAEPACFAPLEVRGLVFDATTETGIGGATIVALDANGGARSRVAVSDESGDYALPIAAERDADGQPLNEAVTLRVAAADYQAFPTPPRMALPIELTTGGALDDALVVDNAATSVALILLPGDTTGLGSVRGTVDHAEPGGVLVVAEQDGKAVSTAVSDASGTFVLFNVPPGETTVSGYRAGLGTEAVVVTVSSAGVDGVSLPASSAALSTVSGAVNIVNAPGGALTSVILALESTFDEDTARGEAPAGMRAGDVDGAFEIPNVPPGRYVVLAAFENDDLVRDPDQSIAGTDIVHISVPEEALIGEGFKVTEALAVVSPGAESTEPVSDAEPVFVWADDSSEDGYELRIFDALGNMVHEDKQVPRVTGSETVTYTWTGASLEAGMIYQFRATSWRDNKGSRTYISATEDLRGVFSYAPQTGQ